MEITTANKDQLNVLCQLVQDSIRHLCRADHQDRQRHLTNWLQARSKKRLSDMLFTADSRAIACTDGTEIIGLAHITHAGMLTLCYVQPGRTAEGVGRLLLAEAERQAAEWGLQELQLISTATAREFYLAHDYEQYAEAVLYIGMPGYPMRKRL